MNDPSENLILRKVQEMHAEIATQFAGIAACDEKTQAQIGARSQTPTGVKAELIRIREDVHAITITVDHHGDRLDRIEQRLGLDTAKH